MRLAEESHSATLVFVFVEAPLKSAERLRSKAEDYKTTWNDVVSRALVTLGGEGDLREIIRIVGTSPRTHSNPTWPSTVRRVVRQSPKISAVRRGRYKLYGN